MTDQLPLGELLCGEAVQYAITPTWVVEMSLEELPAEPFRLYNLYCAHANGQDGMVWLRYPRLAAQRSLDCSERALRNWNAALEDLGLISKVGRFGIRVHRRRDDIAEARRQNAELDKSRRQAAIPKPKRHARASRPKIKYDEAPPLFRWADANRHDGAGSTTVDQSAQPACPCRFASSDRHDGAAQPARPCRHIQNSDIERIQIRNGKTNGAPPTDDKEATKLARQHGADLIVCKQLIELERQVRKRLGSGGVVAIEQRAGRSHPEGGQPFLEAVIDSCADRLVDLDEAEAVRAERAGELIIDETAIKLEDIPFD